MRSTRSFERPKTLAILAVEGKGVVISVGPNFFGEFRSSKNNWYGSTSIAFANFSRVDSEGAV
jgi:hypothetical protein